MDGLPNPTRATAPVPRRPIPWFTFRARWRKVGADDNEHNMPVKRYSTRKSLRKQKNCLLHALRREAGKRCPAERTGAVPFTAGNRENEEDGAKGDKRH